MSWRTELTSFFSKEKKVLKKETSFEAEGKERERERVWGTGNNVSDTCESWEWKVLFLSSESSQIVLSSNQLDVKFETCGSVFDSPVIFSLFRGLFQ